MYRALGWLSHPTCLLRADSRTGTPVPAAETSAWRVWARGWSAVTWAGGSASCPPTEGAPSGCSVSASATAWAVTMPTRALASSSTGDAP